MVQTTFSIDISEANPGEGPIRRSILSPNALMTTPAEGVETLHDILDYAAKTFKDRKGFGYRKLEDTISKTKQVTKIIDGVETKQDKTWTYFQLSPYHHYTYDEGLAITKDIGAGLVQLGLKKGAKVQISASTRFVYTVFQ
jgi:long-chain acyl-CoA synthetase